MKFGILSLVSYVPELEGTPRQVLDRLIADTVAAEELGYDSYWLTEHHFEDFGGILSAPDVVIASMAQRTSRIRLGIAVSQLPLHNPLQLAEAWATVDALSGGRLDFGIGKGFSPWEYKNMDVPLEEANERFDEALAIILASWKGGRFDHSGKHFNYRDVQVLPTPVQQPHPRIWAAAVSSNESYAWAAQRGYDLMTAPHISTPAAVQEGVQVYQRTLRETGRSLGDHEIMANLYVCVAPDRNEALELMGACLDRYEAIKAEARVREGRSGRPPLGLKGWLEQGKLIAGTPEDCISFVESMNKNLSVTHFAATFHLGGMPNDKVRRSMELFMRRVVPVTRHLGPVELPELAAARPV